MKNRADYYEYTPDGTDTWYRKTPPARNSDFERELELLGGKNFFGQPVLRVVWGNTVMSDTARVPQLKYRKIWEGLAGFKYKEDTAEIFVKSPDEVPAGKIAQAVYSQIELGELRWIIEYWQPVENAVETGRFDREMTDEQGRPLFCAPPAEGVYNYFFKVETKDGRFRDLDGEVLEVVKQMWRYHENTPVSQKILDSIEDAKRERRVAAENARREMERPLESADREEIRAGIILEREAEAEARRRAATLIFT